MLSDSLSRLIALGRARAVLPEPAVPPTPAAPSAEGLLNLPRLDSYRRLGMLEEMVNDYLPEMARLVGTLQECATHGDVQGSVAALHSLLGMSGEAGAQALYQQVRKLYVPLLEEGQWPAAPGWLPQLKELAARTEAALRAYCAQQAPSSTA